MAWPLIPLAPLTKATLGAVGYTETNSEDMVYRWFMDVQFSLVGIWHAHLRNGRVDFNKKNSFEYSGGFRVPLSTMTAEILLRDNSDQSRNTALVLGQGEPCHCTQENYTFRASTCRTYRSRKGLPTVVCGEASPQSNHPRDSRRDSSLLEKQKEESDKKLQHFLSLIREKVNRNSCTQWHTTHAQ